MNKQVTVLHSRTAGNRLRVQVIRSNKIVATYKYESIDLFRKAYVNIVANLKRAGYDVTYNDMVV